LTGLAAVAGPGSAALAGLAVLVYNGVYTPLKRRTSFAALAGTLAGAMIPAIGWTAGGGVLDGRPLWWLAAFFVVWQVPHTWLLLLSTPGDYERAGFVPPTRGLGPRQVRRILLVWTAAAAVACAMMPACGVLRRPAPWIACLVAGVWMTARLVRALAASPGDPAAMRRAFDATNLLALTALLAIVADHV
jgi:protoheme IX farnesyltransferase